MSGIFEIFAGIFAFIMSLVPLLVILFVISRVSKMSKQQNRGNVKGDPNAWLQQRQRTQTQGKLVKPLASNKSGEYRADNKSFTLGKSKAGASPKAEAGGSLAETFMKDDRQHDWLARQMREEERILRRGDLMDLGASHNTSCDADMLKRYHLYAEHDDSVDNGEY